MTRFSQFVDAFWDSDITSTRGFDILWKRMKDGRKVCKEVEEYFKERSKAEASYSKSLIQLAKKLDGKDETGSLGSSWRELRFETEKTAQAHEVANKDFMLLQQAVNKFNEDQTNRKDQIEKLVRRYQDNKHSHYNRMNNMKSKYQQRCQEKDAADEVYRNSKQSVTVTTKDLQKMETKKDKCNEQKEQADTLYKQAVEQLETARSNWEVEMEKACKAFQQLEEERIHFLRDIFWKSTNVESQMCVDQDHCCEQVRVILESCDVHEDVLDFIDRNKTGNTRPAPILYEDYYRKRSSVSSFPDQSRSTTMSARPPQPPPPTTRPPPPRPNEPPISPPSRPTDPPPLIYFDDGPQGGEYASIEPTNFHSGQLLRISRRYEAKEPGELTVSVGDQVHFVKVMKDNMIQVKKTDGKLHGLIPSLCVTACGTSTYL